MKTGDPIDLKSGEETQPIPKFVELIIALALDDKADSITFEFDPALWDKIKAEEAKMTSEGIDLDEIKFPDVFIITFKVGNEKRKLEPPPGSLFNPVVRIILNAAAIPYWTKGEVSGELVTVNPDSKWRLESNDLTKRFELQKIHPN